MRILMTTDTVGGVWTYSVELTRALEKLGIIIVLAAMGGRATSAQLRDLKGIRGLEFHDSAYRLEWMPDSWPDVDASGDWLLSLHDRYQVDMVHINGYAHAALPWNGPILAAGHSCVFSWFAWVEKKAPAHEWETYRQRATKGLRAAGCVVSPTAAMLGELNAFYGPFRQSRVIPNGRSASEFLPRKKEDFVFGAGRVWDKAKNIELLATTAPRLSWPVFVAGHTAPPHGKAVQYSGVRMLGPLNTPQMADWLGRAAIFAEPARYEPFGLCALEAALAGCCLVLGDIPFLREVWGESALYVSPEDDDALTQTLQELIDSPALRAEKAKAARTRALRFGPNEMARNYCIVYEALLNDNKKSKGRQ